MKTPLLSICIPVYNQSSLLRVCLNELLRYKGNDIEVVVNDNCSEENLKEVIDSFNDNRLKYYRNETNLGQDLNIIQSF